MAKVGFVNRQTKRERMSNNDAAKRAELKAKIINEELGFEERMEARNQLNKMRTNGSKIRLRNRCQITGRPRGVYRKFGLCRITFREMASDGKLPGVTKSSW
ncbi:MAG: 30S ribosomal protein S14 [Magnetococcales bacterium]|nr:30S ribosomal protein S14 [Magnetococcales bacterium]PPR19715.1 MAG: 30S ribosomal protein S14 [Pseudomonadota bacterium]|tara:strand:+ start:1111 stop:1416 length:306 start_codon:yes stop_codon:yes gene_type:complete